jgi:Ca2+-binding EF-hand superfamily protein
MGAEYSTENRNDMKEDQLKYSNLNPNNIGKLKVFFDKNPTSSIDKKGLISLLAIQKKEADLIFEFYDLDGSGQIDSYEFICGVAMLCHSSIEVKICINLVKSRGAFQVL